MVAALLLIASSVALRPDVTVEVNGSAISLADVASLERMDPGARNRLAGRVLARLPDGRHSVTLSRPALAALIRRSLPGISVASVDGGPITLRRAAPAAATEPAGHCLVLVNPVAAGALLSAADAAPAPCPRIPPAAALGYQRQNRAVRAETDLAAGTPLGRIRLPASPGVAAGERLMLTSTAGPVRIRREVTALQPGRGGGRLFVRTDDGEILAAPVAEAAE